MTNNPQICVADIGGTNARFALATKTPDGEFDITQIKVFKCSDFTTFTKVFQAYNDFLQNDLNIELPRIACIAIAAIIEHDSVAMTSIDWSFSKKQLKQVMGLDELEVLNDFASQAMAMPFIPKSNLVEIKPGQPIAGKPRIILGPGTGLGVGMLVPARDKWIPIASQGGHVNFSPTDEVEQKLLALYLNNLSHVSFETFVCGSGLANIYAGLLAIDKDIDVAPSPLSPAEVSEAATVKKDPIADKALALFFRFLGRFAGNAALTCGGTGGVYLAGGILPRVKDELISSEFTLQFADKGVSSSFVDDIPIYLFDHPNPALIGSAAYFFEGLK